MSPIPRRATVLVVTLLLAGCGGGDRGDTRSDAGAFRAELSEINGSFQSDTAEVREALEKAVRARDAQAVSRGLRRMVAVGGDLTQRIERVDPPRELAPAHARLLRANNEGAAVARRFARRFEAHPEDAATLWPQLLAELGPLQTASLRAIDELSG